MLVLMQDPSEVATFTGFISPDNNDPTANNSTIACDAAGLTPRARVHWNIFPWWVNVTKLGLPVDQTRRPQTYTSARPLAAAFLLELVSLLTELSVIVLLGNQAHRGYDELPSSVHRGILARRIVVLRCPSCSPHRGTTLIGAIHSNGAGVPSLSKHCVKRLYGSRDGPTSGE